MPAISNAPTKPVQDPTSTSSAPTEVAPNTATSSTRNPRTLEQEVAVAERTVQSTKDDLSKCGLFDTALGTKGALKASLQVEETRLALLRKATENHPADVGAELRSIHRQLRGAQEDVNRRMDNAVTATSIAHGSAQFANQAGIIAVEAAATATAGPVVGSAVSLGIRSASSLAITTGELAVGDETQLGERLTKDFAGAAFNAVGGKAAQFVGSSVQIAAKPWINTALTAGAGGSTLTAVNVGGEMMARSGRGEQIVQKGDLQRFTIDAAANSASWAIGDRTSKTLAAQKSLASHLQVAAASSSIGVAGEYAKNGEVTSDSFARGVGSTLGSTAVGYHLASMKYQVAPLSSAKPGWPKDLAPKDNKYVSLVMEKNGEVSVHLERPGVVFADKSIWVSRNGQPKPVEAEFEAAMATARANPEISRVRVATPLFAKMEADGTTPQLRPMAERFMAKQGGQPTTPTLTSDTAQLGVLGLSVAKAVVHADPKGVVRELANAGDYKYTAGFTVDVKPPMMKE